jgi:hypothetical protein
VVAPTYAPTTLPSPAPTRRVIPRDCSGGRVWVECGRGCVPTCLNKHPTGCVVQKGARIQQDIQQDQAVWNGNSSGHAISPVKKCTARCECAATGARFWSARLWRCLPSWRCEQLLEELHLAPVPTPACPPINCTLPWKKRRQGCSYRPLPSPQSVGCPTILSQCGVAHCPRRYSPTPPTAGPKYGASESHFAFRIYDAFPDPSSEEAQRLLTGWQLMNAGGFI